MLGYETSRGTGSLDKRVIALLKQILEKYVTKLEVGFYMIHWHDSVVVTWSFMFYNHDSLVHQNYVQTVRHINYDNITRKEMLLFLTLHSY
jgi:hypothetical protein